ncbi:MULTISPECIES: hypothetical protein [unclassified Brevundimonas]|uniref:hypothetical protein n=1 Tax=unclassified Brevundimonas TaxID=2622653 RepID=UPI0025C215FC|nr:MULTISPECIES: hypothetical protein [unclassified Brevundimonas]
MKKAAILLPVAVALSLAACDNRPSEAPAAAPAPSAPVTAEAAVAEQAPQAGTPVDVADPQIRAQAFRAAWGAPPPVTYRPVKPGEHEAQTYAKATLVPVSQGLYALISEGQGGEGHVSAGSLAIHYLKRTADGFERVGAWPAFLVTGTWGSPPRWDIRQDLMNAPTLVATAGGTWQGYTCGWAHVIELTPQKPVTRIDQIHLSYSDGGARGEDEATDVSGRILAGEKGRTLRVRYSGDMNATVTYAKVGEVYDPVDMPDIPTC